MSLYKQAEGKIQRKEILKNSICRKTCPICGHHKARYKPRKDTYKCCKCKSIFDKEEIIIKEKESRQKGWRRYLGF